MAYRRTQWSRAAPITVIALIVLTILVATRPDQELAATVILLLTRAVVSVVTLAFGRLTVTVDSSKLAAWFGPGWPRRVIPLTDIVAVRKMRSKWYEGWGIRKIRGGWMYSVWGLDAIELDLASGKKFRIGSDQPDDLLAVLQIHVGR